MNILMMTNTFEPHVGGVARSVAAFAEAYRHRGHQVLVTAPHFEGTSRSSQGVVRVPSIPNFNGTDFSVPVPIPGFLHSTLEQFQPDIVHSHHPFLLGDTALRISANWDIPVVFTHHTQYEKYSHYVPGDSDFLKRFVVDLVRGYCNLCDAVVAPSETIAKLLGDDQVTTPIQVIPTGVDFEYFAQGDGTAFRARQGIPADAFIVGHVGRLAPEKNLEFLTKAVAEFLRRHPRARFLVAGVGPSEDAIYSIVKEAAASDQLIMLGIVPHRELRDVYAAMNVFTFASQSETQGMVLTEAQAAGVPVVAGDAPGVREVVRDRFNGRLLNSEDLPQFVDALSWIKGMPVVERESMKTAIAATAEEFSMHRCADKALELYAYLCSKKRIRRSMHQSPWSAAKRRLEEEWKIWSNVADAAGDAFWNFTLYSEPTQ